MLLKQKVLDGIAAGTISLVFRRWKRPTVRPGGTLRTAVGVLAIEAVEPIKLAAITPRDARRAGYDSLDDLLKELRSGREGRLYRIKLRYAGEDPRIALRERAELTAAEVAELQERLNGLDKASRRGPWTREVLRAIKGHPDLRAADLAVMMGRDKASLKIDVRKLKELGLTESRQPGYRLSPRGRTLLAKL